MIEIKDIFGNTLFVADAATSVAEAVKAAIEAKTNLTWANFTGANLTGANFTGANLTGADLYGANLTWANFTGANLTRINLIGVNLTEANLTEANLTEANLYGANLYEANLNEANLNEASLTEANLYGANLYGANLTRINLTGANLTEANLTEANLYGANLTGANLSGANLSGANNINFLICPEVGAFTAFKKVKTPIGESAVIRIQIDSETPRTNGIGSRKCRAESVKVIGLESGPKAEYYMPYTATTYDESCRYVIGEYTVAHEYNDDPRLECAGGIHFFITKKEAEAW